MTISETVEAGPFRAEVSVNEAREVKVDLHGANDGTVYQWARHQEVSGQDAVDLVRAFARNLSVAVARVKVAADAAYIA